MSEKKKMTAFEAIDNFWYYHKWKVAGVMFVLLVIFVVAGYINANTDNRAYDFNMVSVFARPMTSGDYTIEKQIEDVISDVDNNGEVAIKTSNYYITERADGETDKIYLSQFEQSLNSAEGDVILFDRANLDRFLPKDFFADISDYADLSQVSQEDIVYRQDVPVAVRLSDSKALKDMQFVIDDIYVSVMFTPDNAEQSVLASRGLAKGVIEKLTLK